MQHDLHGLEDQARAHGDDDDAQHGLDHQVHGACMMVDDDDRCRMTMLMIDDIGRIFSPDNADGSMIQIQTMPLACMPEWALPRAHSACVIAV